MGPDVFYLVHRPFHVPDIVQGIEYAEDIDPVLMGCRDKLVDHVIRIMTITNKVLAAKEHLDGCMLQFSL